MTEQRTLVKKLVKVMQQVKYIQKRGVNKFHGYTYATEADVADKVREALSEHNIIMLPAVTNREIREITTRKGNTEFITSVDMEFTFYDGDSGEELTVKTSGEGQDAGDKGIYKAITGAQKYAMMKAFLIPTGDDPEEDSGEDKNGERPDIKKEAPPKKQEGEKKPDPTQCELCQAPMTKGQITLSEKRHGQALCPKCQDSIKEVG